MTFGGGTVTGWWAVSSTRVTATTTENWRFVNYDATTGARKSDLGMRRYRNTYMIDYVAGMGWKVSLDDVANPKGDPI